MNDLTFGPGPTLTWRCYPHPDPIDVSTRAHEFLVEPVELRGEVNLGDVFQLFEKSPALKEAYRRYWANQLCAEAQKGPLPDEESPSEGQLEFLELYRDWGYNSFEKTYSGTHHLHLHGVGPVLTEDAPEHGLKAGERVKWGLSMTSVRKLLRLPIHLKSDFTIREDDIDSVNFHETLATARCDTVLLGELLSGLLHELSFYGGPEGQEEFAEELDRRMGEVEAGKAVTVDLDDLFEKFDPTPAWQQMYESLGDVPYKRVRAKVREIPDAEPAGPWLTQAFEGQVRVRAEYAQLGGRDFRRASRAARSQALIEAREKRKAGKN